MEDAIALFLLVVLVTTATLVDFVQFNKPDSDKLCIVDKVYREKGKKLLELLRCAGDEMSNKKGSISLYSSYDSYKALADHIVAQVALIEQNDADLSPDAVGRFKAGFHEAYMIFLPTRDWDDANGSAALANEILSLLKEILGLA